MIRFNDKGEFNNSFHLTRKGINPETLKDIIDEWSKKIQNVSFSNQGYELILDQVTSKDLVYLDPPYYHNKGRYFGSMNFNEFFNFLHNLNNKDVKYILSFDGKREEKVYKTELPKELFKRHLYFNSGKSASQKVLNSKIEDVFESVYLNY
jgi:DNA adenine methylase